MAVPWEHAQRASIVGILRQHPAASGMCAEAARRILPVAAVVDADATARILRPTEGRFVAAKSREGKRWRHHVSVRVTAHYVDVLTGPDGREEEAYLDAYFEFPDALEWEDADLRDETL